jgi:hypothetical protein
MLSRVRVSVTVVIIMSSGFHHDLFGFTATTAVVHFTNVQHINQRLVFWYHFTFDYSGPLLSGVFFALISLLSAVDFSCPLGLL